MLVADFVRNDGRDLNVRPRINTRPVGQPTAPRRLAFLNLSPNVAGTRGAVSLGESDYTALILGLRRRLSAGFAFNVNYTLAEANSTIGSSVDQLNANNIQEAELLYDDPRVYGPTSTTDSRHAGSFSAIWQVKGLTIFPVYTFRSPLPVSTTEGIDRNLNGEINDLPDRAFQYDGVGNAPKDIGPCENYNCGRGAWRSQMNLRVSYGFRLVGSTRLEAIGEIFNVFNVKNASAFTATRLLGTGLPNPNFMQPTNFSGDFQQPEQRVGQLGFRFTF